MGRRIRLILGVIGALGVISSLSGCILIERGGHGGHCEVPRVYRVCDSGPHGHHR